MADESREIIIDIEVEARDFNKEIGNVNSELEENRKQLTELKKDYSENSTEIARLEEQNRKLTQSKRQLIKEQQTESGSLDELRLNLAALTKERNNINKSTAEGIERFHELQRQIKSTSEEIKKQEEAAGDFRRSIGNYQRALDGAKGAIKGVGLALKALGIGLVIKALEVLTDLFSQNQQVADFFKTTTEALSIVFSDFISFILDNSQSVIDTLKAFFEDPLTPIERLAGTIKNVLIESLLFLLEVQGLVADAFTKLFRGEFSEALDSITEAGTRVSDVFTKGLFPTIVEGFNAATSAISDYTSEVVKTAQANVQLANSFELAQAQQQLLIQQSERAAEQLRQFRDDVSRDIRDRIRDNNNLLDVLNQQEQQELRLVDLSIQRAQAELAKNNNIENQVALIEAQTERADVLNRIEGLRSEQLVNQVALEQELRDLSQSRQIAETERAISAQTFQSQFIEDEVARIEFQRQILQQENELETNRLNTLISNLNEGTQARVDAEQELLNKKQEFNQQDLLLTMQLEDAKTRVRRQAADAAIGFALEVFNESSVFGKAFALAQIAADTGRALAGALANANTPTPDNVATGGLAGIGKYLALATTILSNSRRAVSIVNSGGRQSASASAASGVPSGGGASISSVSSANNGVETVNPTLLSQFNQEAQQNAIAQDSSPVVVSVVDINEAQANRQVKVNESSLS